MCNVLCLSCAAVPVTIEKLTEIAIPPPQQGSKVMGVWPQDPEWPSLKGDHEKGGGGVGKNPTPSNRNADAGRSSESQDWNQNRKKQEWNQVLKNPGEQSEGNSRGGSSGPGGSSSNVKGSKIQTGLVPPGLGATGPLLPPPTHQGSFSPSNAAGRMDRRSPYLPPLNPGPLHHGPPMEMAGGAGMQARSMAHSHSRPPPPSVGMGFGPPPPSLYHMASRPGPGPGHPADMGMRLPSSSSAHSGSKLPPPPPPHHDMPFHPQPAYMRWMGYGGVQDPNFNLTGPPLGGPGPGLGPRREEPPRPLLRGMPHPPPMPGGYFHDDKRGLDGRYLDMPGGRPVPVPYLSPDMSRSRSAEVEGAGVRGGGGGGVRGQLVLLRGLPGSGKTTLAR